MSPVELSPTPQAGSSATLWAQPSKEWIIPARPKPGRKPKKEPNTDTTSFKDDIDEDSSASKRVQNRAAQRAFRERKQTQLAELQARLHSYEQGEIERNVALQSIAKRMKDENEELRKENQILREKITRMEQERDEFFEKDKKRAYDDTSLPSPDLPLPADVARKRPRADEDEQETKHLSLPSLPPSASCLVTSPEIVALADIIAPGGRESRSQRPVFPSPPRISDLLPFAATNETTCALDGQGPNDPYACILCSPDVPCVCGEVTVQQTANIGNRPVHQSENLDNQSILSLDQSLHADTPPSTSTSILDNLPAFRAPVPIRRRAAALKANSVFPITPIATTAATSKCSGDPENCMACADDNFGKAFCQAIGHTVNSTLLCIDCPKRTHRADKLLVGGCCGDMSKCGSCGIAPILSPTTPPRTPETIPTNDAWRQLKSHPNVAFADLTLLAEVVARRSKCTGSRIVMSPAPGSVTPDNSTHSHHEANVASEEQTVLLTDPHEHLLRQQQGRQESPPQLVPQHVLIECGRRRVREVNTVGVREALRLLDQKFAHMR